MSDYVCPECECGFSERMGREYIRVRPFPSDESTSLWLRIVNGFCNAFFDALSSHYKIICPTCGYEFGEEVDDDG